MSLKRLVSGDGADTRWHNRKSFMSFKKLRKPQ